MRKIYPFLLLPFNKFVIFVIYGLSIALITLAQGSIEDDCIKETILVPQEKKVIIGYVRLPMESSKIPWDKYDYINVIAYSNGNLRPEHDDITGQVKELVKFRNENFKNDNNNRTKVLLSLRSYDVTQWPKGPEDPRDNNDYAKAIDNIIDGAKKTIRDCGLDGIDIEYPGMRGRICDYWDDEEDGRFLKFVSDLKNEIGNKTLMLTVGRDTIEGFKDDDITYLNIETYHNSFYQNQYDVPNGVLSSYPNNPLDEYNRIYSEWARLIDRKKIIMGVDFGNTIQVVDSLRQNISQDQIIKYPPSAQFDVSTLIANNVLPQITRIKDLCTLGNPDTSNPFDLKIYSWPWNSFTAFFQQQSIQFCANTTNSFNSSDTTIPWKHNFDKEITKTPWLYRVYNTVLGNPPPSQTAYMYVSYEDVESLHSKLEFVTSQQIGGVSISDVSYDVDDDDGNSLLGYMQVIRGKGPDTESKPDSTTSPKPSQGKKKSIVGAIVGPIVSIFAVALIGFFVYKHRRQPRGHPKPEAGDFTPKGGPLQTHASLKNELPSEPTSRLVPNTAVIPIASGHVTAMFDFVGKEETDLSFKKGDIIEVLEKGDGPNDWWVGRVNGVVGEFPGNYVKET